MAGVLTSATYGLYTVGLSTSGKTQLQAMVSRQLRALAALPAHTTHVTNSAIREQFGFTDVIQQLCDQATKHMASLEQTKAEQPGHICVQAVAMQHLDEVIRDLAPKERRGKLLEVGQDEAEGVCCPDCGICFATLKGMRQHRAAKHKIKVARHIVFQPELRAMEGLPQCSGCHHKFQTWDGLRKHIEQGSCRTPILVEASASTASNGKGKTDECAQVMSRETDGIPLHSAAVQTVIREQGWEALVQSEHAEALKQHCCICGRWIVDPVALKRHIKGAHKDTWEQYQHQLQHECSKLQHTLSRDKTCQYCGRTAYNRRYHQCCVIFQSAFLGLYHHGASDRCDDRAHLWTPAPSLSANAQTQAMGKRTSSPMGGENKRHKQARRAGHRGHRKNVETEELAASFGARKERKSSQTTAANHAPLAHDDGTDLAPQHPEGCQGRPHGLPKTGLDGRTGQPDLPSMGSNQKSAGDIHDSGTNRRAGDHQGPGGHSGPDQSKPHPQVPCAEASQRHGGSRKQSGLQSGGQPKSARSAPALQPHAEAGRKLVLDDYWRPSKTRQPATKRSGTSPTETDLNPQQRLLVNQKLINNSSTCYVNASMMLILWQAAGTAWHSLPEAWKVQLGKLQWNPASFLRFSMMGWRDLHMQHDAGEYLSFILPKLGWTACVIQWSCGIQAGDNSRTLVYNAKSNTQLLALIHHRVFIIRICRCWLTTGISRHRYTRWTQRSHTCSYRFHAFR